MRACVSFVLRACRLTDAGGRGAVPRQAGVARGRRHAVRRQREAVEAGERAGGAGVVAVGAGDGGAGMDGHVEVGARQGHGRCVTHTRVEVTELMFDIVRQKTRSGGLPQGQLRPSVNNTRVNSN